MMVASGAIVDPFKKLRTAAGKWRVNPLLETGVQPFENLSDSELALLGGGLDPRALIDPIKVSEDGILVDGHQRLRWFSRKGVELLGAESVKILTGVNKDTALETAVRLNLHRRHLTVEDKAAAARRLMTERGWSQARVAELFGVTRPAVSQWLSGTAGVTPTATVGKDGRIRDTSGIAEANRGRADEPDSPDAAHRKAWFGPSASMPKAIRAFEKMLLDHPLGAAVRMLDETDIATMERRLQSVMGTIQKVLADAQDAQANEADRALRYDG